MSTYGKQETVSAREGEYYVPVAVFVDEHGNPTHAQVDTESAPWMYSGTREGIRYGPTEGDPEEYDWTDATEREAMAVDAFLSGLLTREAPRPSREVWPPRRL